MLYAGQRQLDELVNKVKTSLEENKLDFSFNNLEELLLLTRKTRDFDLLLNATKLYIIYI